MQAKRIVHQDYLEIIKLIVLSLRWLFSGFDLIIIIKIKMKNSSSLKKRVTMQALKSRSP